MSGLIDIWTLERERLVRVAGAAQAFRSSVVSLGGGERQERRDAARSESAGSSSAAKPSDGVGAVLVDAAEKQQAAASASASASAGSPPGFVREDAFLNILVDCFGQ